MEERVDELAAVRAAKYGDKRAFGLLVERYQQSLVGSACQIVRKMDTAEDLAQEALVEAYRKLPALHDPGKFRPWLFVILRNKCLAYLRRHRLQEVSLDLISEEDLSTPPESEELVELLAQLSLADREILAARYFQELSYEEIAEAFRVTPVAARVRCARARTRLRALARETEEAETRRLMQGALGVMLADRHAPETFVDRVLTEVATMQQVATMTGALATGSALTKVGGLLLAGTGWKIAAGSIAAIVLGIGLWKTPIVPTPDGPVPVIETVVKRDEKRENAPAQSCMRTLPDGTKVALVAINFAPEENAAWWAPDGAVLETPPEVPPFDASQRREEDYPADGCRQFLFRITEQSLEKRYQLKFRVNERKQWGNAQIGTSVGDSKSNGSRVSLHNIILSTEHAVYPPTGTLLVNLENHKGWEPVLNLDEAYFANPAQAPEYDAIPFLKKVDAGDETDIVDQTRIVLSATAYEQNTQNTNYRFVAVDRQGTKHYFSSHVPIEDEVHIRLYGIQPSKLSMIHFEAQPKHELTFENVALWPNQ